MTKLVSVSFLRRRVSNLYQTWNIIYILHWAEESLRVLLSIMHKVLNIHWFQLVKIDPTVSNGGILHPNAYQATFKCFLGENFSPKDAAVQQTVVLIDSIRFQNNFESQNGRLSEPIRNMELDTYVS
jgi:hypothetical protein